MLKLDWTIIWAIVNILILFVLLRIFLFKPLHKFMDERSASVQNDLDSAKKSKEEAEALRQSYEDTLDNARAEANDIIAKAREEAVIEKERIIRQSKDEAAQLISEANKSIENERRRVMQQAQSQIADLAIEAASRIVGENVDDDKNRKLVDDFLSDEEVIKQ